MRANNRITKKSRQGGFTLVEIAIVLVIIGLILGGVLQGQTMIENARYKNFAQEVDSYRAAYHTFRDMYRGLPGDLGDNALLNAAATEGDGDGTMDGGGCSGTDESCQVWSHLRFAELIPGDPSENGQDSRPNHAYGGLISGMETSGAGNGVTGHKIRFLTFPGEVALRYDVEFDDGDSQTGRVSRTGAGDYGTANRTIIIEL